jgi:hypothetical protein
MGDLEEALRLLGEFMDRHNEDYRRLILNATGDESKDVCPCATCGKARELTQRVAT